MAGLYSNRVCQLTDNPDISGLGVRLAFYIQAYLTIIITFLPDADVQASYWTMTITAFALFTSALALHSMDELSLYQGILVSVLLYLHAYAAAASMQSSTPSASPALPVNGKTARELEREWWIIRFKLTPPVLIATAFGLFLWIRAPIFGSQPECNNKTLFVVLGLRLSATAGGRVFALIVVSAHCFPLLLGIIFFIDFVVWDARTSPSYHGRRAFLLNAGARARDEARFRQSVQAHWYRRANPDGPRHRFFLFNWYLKAQKYTRHPRAMMFHFGIALACFVVIMELTIKENSVLILQANIDNSWTLGQIFPIIMLAVPLTSIIQWAQQLFCHPKTPQNGQYKFVVGLDLSLWHEHIHARLDV